MSTIVEAPLGASMSHSPSDDARAGRDGEGGVAFTRRTRLKSLLSSFGRDTVRYHAQQLLYRALNDLDRVPDDVLEMLAKEVVSNWRFSQRLNRQNRRIGAR